MLNTELLKDCITYKATCEVNVSEDKVRYVSYGIIAVNSKNTIIAEVKDVTSIVEDALSIVKTLINSDVSPIHLSEVIYDMIPV